MTDYHRFLNPNDAVATSFWIICIAMVAATVFFLMESMAVGNHWKTSMNVGALVTLVTAVHYFYMREFWVQIHASPILYRYIELERRPGDVLAADDRHHLHAALRVLWRDQHH